ncbi:MAG: twin-arginine translocase subunit TatC [Bacteroidaceae bacterium]|nr:twin-arginine translocase subunit TatC [Bacteroidaceae bacterium]
MDDSKMTFWDHLEVLRRIILRILAIAATVAVVAFCFKNLLFRIILAPSKPGFITYRLFAGIADRLGADSSSLLDFSVDLFSTMLTAQFMTHMKMAFCFALLLVIPYIIFELYGFVAPALRSDERKYSTTVIVWSYLLFMMGVLLNYYLIFPLAFRFLGTYQVSPDVPNVITLTSYTDMLLTLTVMMGVMFELPVLSWFLAKLGLLNAVFMKKYRRHAILVIFIVSAIITPTTDVFTLTVVAIPIYLLYEASIMVVRKSART